MDKTYKTIFQKKSVTALFFLSLITFGIYTAFWYIKRAKEFENLGTEKKLNKTLTIIFLILTCLGLIAFIFVAYYSFSLMFQMITEFASGTTPSPETIGMTTVSYISNIISILSFIFYLILGFAARAVINEVRHKHKIEIKVNGLLTFFFNFLYLQYEINRTIDGREYQRRVGPWAWLIILILIPLFSFLLFLIGVVALA